METANNAAEEGSQNCHQYNKCDYVGTSNFALQYHTTKFHTAKGLKPFSCTFPNCGYRSRFKSNRDSHLKTHSSEKPYACEFPGCNYRTKERFFLRKHQRTHDDPDSMFACDFPGCEYRTIVKNSFQRHRETHDPNRERKFQCSLCTKAFARKSCLDKHIVFVHTKDRTAFVCDFRGCEFRTVVKSSLKRHRQTHDPNRERNFQCSLCSKAFGTKLNLRYHVERVHPKEWTWFACDFPGCKHRATLKGNLKKHQETHDPNKRELRKSQELKRFSCTFPNCDYRCQFKNKLALHAKNHSEEKPYACEFAGCSYRTKRSEYLNKHRLSHDPSSMLACDFPGCEYRSICKGNFKRHHETHNPKRERKFKCPLCPRAYAVESILSSHIIHVHTKERTKRCELCDRTFYSTPDLKHHLRRVHSVGTVYKKFKCGVCDYSSPCKATLRLHLDTHDVSKRYPCETCDFRSSNKSSLDHHRRNSCPGLPRTRKYQCTLCKKKISSHNNLRRHVKAVHMGERRHKCDQCGYTTDNASTLRTHMSKEHATSRQVQATGPRATGGNQGKDRGFKCDFPGCSFSTSSSPNLRAHRRRHFPELKNKKCPMCPKTFHCKSSVKAHVGHVHVGEKPFKCELCDYATSHLKFLQLHKTRRHTDKKPFITLGRRRRGNQKVNSELQAESSMKISEVHGCPFCNFTHDEKMTVVRHTMSHREAVVVLQKFFVL